jgi:Domain of unknown function (DUF4160)
MPKLYEYLGLDVFFYSNEHQPVHVHGRCQGREGRADLRIVEGRVMGIDFVDQPGRPPLKPTEMDHFREVVRARAQDIVQKWVDYFVLHKSVSLEKITKQLP